MTHFSPAPDEWPPAGHANPMQLALCYVLTGIPSASSRKVVHILASPHFREAHSAAQPICRARRPKLRVPSDTVLERRPLHIRSYHSVCSAQQARWARYRQTLSRLLSWRLRKHSVRPQRASPLHDRQPASQRKHLALARAFANTEHPPQRSRLIPLDTPQLRISYLYSSFAFDTSHVQEVPCRYQPPSGSKRSGEVRAVSGAYRKRHRGLRSRGVSFR